MAAFLTIFCNILLNPLNRHASQDLELLSQATDLIKGLPSIHLALPNAIHIARIEGLIIELSGLAKLAVTEAQRASPTSSPWSMFDE